MRARFNNAMRSHNKLARTPNTNPQNGAPIFNNGNPPSVTRKAINPPSGNGGLKALSNADCKVRNMARPANVLRKAAGAAIKRDVTVGALIPNRTAKKPRKIAAIQCCLDCPPDTRIALTGPVRHVDMPPYKAVNIDMKPHDEVIALVGGLCPADLSTIMPCAF